MITLNKVDFQKSRELLRDKRRATPTRESKKNKDTSLELARLSPFVPFGLSGLRLAFLTLSIT